MCASYDMTNAGGSVLHTLDAPGNSGSAAVVKNNEPVESEKTLTSITATFDFPTGDTIVITSAFLQDAENEEIEATVSIVDEVVTFTGFTALTRGAYYVMFVDMDEMPTGATSTKVEATFE